MPQKIFISYRRDDSKYQARMIFDALTKILPRDHVFMDIDSIKPGDDFVEILEGWVDACDVLLCLIGPGWLAAMDPKTGKRRLENPNDFVRIELREALRRGIPVVPVLLDGATMPDADDLPDDLKKLVRRNAEFVEYRTFDTDVARLVKRLNLGGAVIVPPQPRAESAPDHNPGEGRIEIDAAIVNGAAGRRFLPGAGQTEWFRDFEGGPEMVVVPAGKFWMGSPDSEPHRDKAESPQHLVTVAKPFAAGRFAVTFAEWDAAQIDGEWRRVTGLEPRRPDDEGWGRETRPIINVNWDDASAYVKWLSAKTGQDYRLLSEAEWEYVCRSGTVTPFWWGSSITPEQANYNGTADPYPGGRKGEYRQKTLPVESFKANPWGLYQVHGNVWEWCEDCWNESYTGAPSEGSAWTTGDCKVRALRGGSWDNDPGDARAATRYRNHASFRVNIAGFRLARTL